MEHLNLSTFDGDDLKDLLGAIDEIPFGNSAFMITDLIVHHESDSRNYRQVLLEMWQKYQALKEAQFRRRRSEINRLKTLKKLADETDDLERQLLDIDLQETDHKILIEDKLIKDAIVELRLYHALYKQLPRLTRQEFEAQEKHFHMLRAIQAAEREMLTGGTISQGSAEYLHKLGFNPHAAQAELREKARIEQDKQAKMLE